MSKRIFVNLPVDDLERSTAFYEALGFGKNAVFSDERASCMVWSDEIYVMLLTKDFYKHFTDGKDIIDAKKTSGTLLAISLDSKDEVQRFADTAKEAGGRVYQVDMGGGDMMFGYEVEDLDGHIWEPHWMDEAAMQS
ncbi:MAG TPA: VOC family protein [Candidatus Saccharimonadales bacterium]|nr:VOC family protein [Candidatus Saccharimonadales bacterium]